MDPITFAQYHLQPYKIKGSEIIPHLCPYCHGGQHHDKETFALNMDKLTFNCKRGSCGRQGTFTQLCRDFGEEPNRMENFEMRYKPQKQYKVPRSVISPAKKRVEDYLKLRGFSKETWERRKVGEVNGNIAFPYYENGQLVLVKFRKPEKYTGQGQKAWREEGGKPVLWGMDDCDPNLPLVIVEGEMDALALDECGVKNVVSVPSGAQDLTFVETCWEWLEKFNKIIIWGDNDEPGQEMVRKLILRLGEWRCYVVQSKHKDANVSLVREGKEATAQAVYNAKPVPIHGLIDLADVVPFDYSKVQRVRSNISWLDRTIGGFYMGELSVWTGRRGEGKSTLLGQLLLEAVDQGVAVCAYSGELRADRFQYWINLQAAGKKNIQGYFDPLREREVAYLSKDVVNKIREWYRGKFFLYDNSVSKEDAEGVGILKIFEYAVKRYDCKVFLVDNLMTSRFDVKRDSDYYRAQSNFVGELVSFAKKFDVHIHLVAHPRKGSSDLENDSIAGTGDIPNRADNVFAVQRVTEENATFNTVITVLKNRSEGVMNEQIGLCFDPESKRFWQLSDPAAKDKQYGWERVSLEPAFEQTKCPWDD